MFWKLIRERSHSSFFASKGTLHFPFELFSLDILDPFKERIFGDIFCWLSFYRPHRRLRLYLIYLPLLLWVLSQLGLIEYAFIKIYWNKIKWWTVWKVWTQFSWFVSCILSCTHSTKRFVSKGKVKADKERHRLK